MRGRASGPWSAVVVILLACAVGPAVALFERVYSLREILDSSSSVATARVASVNPGARSMVLRVEGALKGKPAFRRLAVDLSRGGFGHPDAVMRRVAAGLPVVVFASDQGDRKMALLYTNGTWLHCSAPAGGSPDARPWRFRNAEIYLRRTFSGTTEELTQLLRDVDAGRRQAPEPDLKVSPGLGPELAPEKLVRVPPPQPAASVPSKAAPSAPPRIPSLSPEERRRAVDLARSQGRPETEALTLVSQHGLRTATLTLNLAREARVEPAEVLAVQRQCRSWDDARQALLLARDYQGGERDYPRTAREILRLRDLDEWLTWDDVRGALERARGWFSPLQDPARTILKLRVGRAWQDVDQLLNTEKQHSVSLEKLVALRKAYSWEDIQRALQSARDYKKDLDLVLRLQSGRTWDEVRRLLDTERSRSVPLADLVKLRGSFDWQELNTGMDLARDYRKPLSALLGWRAARDWDELRQALDRQRRYGAPVGEVLRLRRSLPWSEVDSAYSTAAAGGVPVSRVMGLKAQGLDWQEVVRALPTRKTARTAP